MSVKVTVDLGEALQEMKEQAGTLDLMAAYAKTCDVLTARPIGTVDTATLIMAAITRATHDEIMAALLEKYSVGGLLNTIRDYAHKWGMA